MRRLTSEPSSLGPRECIIQTWIKVILLYALVCVLYHLKYVPWYSLGGRVYGSEFGRS